APPQPPPPPPSHSPVNCVLFNKPSPTPPPTQIIIGCSLHGSLWAKLALWDGVVCWPHAPRGATVNVSCPAIFSHFTANTGKNNIHLLNRVSDPTRGNPPPCQILLLLSLLQVSYFGTIKVIYTVGHSASLLVLTAAVIILLLFRRLHCTRNYIHIQLFITFILRGVSVFVKDAVLFGDGDIDHCTFSTAGCKTSVVFCYFCVMANHFWLLVEGLYLNSLLLASFTRGQAVGLRESTHQSQVFSWESPSHFLPQVNFVLFFNIIRILFQKLNPREIHMVNSSQYRRLVKSTLLLIPLFGVHYIICAFPPDHVVHAVKLYLDLCIGSFQGFIVGVLYCFLNQEVSGPVYCPAILTRNKLRPPHLTSSGPGSTWLPVTQRVHFKILSLSCSIPFHSPAPPSLPPSDLLTPPNPPPGQLSAATPEILERSP
uniref:G-protein coupled receptors family 2 profile 2 domain-containing protein n=1 Tax=Callorhinchus milii TaxID=7868 RepID=A0A4W3HAK7_CALMI